MSAVRFTGSSVRRVEDRRLLTGEATVPGRSCAPPAALTSGSSGARTPGPRSVGIDASAARAMPGVIAVLTAAELDARVPELVPVAADGLHAPAHRALARTDARFVGDPVAVVVADSPEAAAEDAAELVDVRYDVAPAVVDMDDARHPGRSPGLAGPGHQCDAPPAPRGRRAPTRRWRAPPSWCGSDSSSTGSPMRRWSAGGCIARVDAESGLLDVVTGHQSPHDLRHPVGGGARPGPGRVRVRCAGHGRFVRAEERAEPGGRRGGRGCDCCSAGR